eukprot:9468486-Pyramimonas_sp.AAC.1
MGLPWGPLGPSWGSLGGVQGRLGASENWKSEKGKNVVKPMNINDIGLVRPSRNASRSSLGGFLEASGAAWGPPGRLLGLLGAS